MARAKSGAAKTAADSKKTPMPAPEAMYLLFTVVNKEKAEFYVDLLHNYEINLQTVLTGHGTATKNIQELLGLTNNDKAVIISTVKKSRTAEVLSTLEEKFKTVKRGGGIAYTVPISSTIGVAIYQFLSNTTSGGLI
ncbi:MAG: hypothetical protein IIX96_02955 [Clostridia bacterium]|nr:hypothetical protein [Clostridia bacterium]